MKNRKIPIAKLGKSHGVRGWQKIHILSDFPEQFKPGSTFKSDREDLTIEKIDLKRGLVKIKGIDTPEDAKKITNRQLYTTEEETRENIKLKEGEYFWFDIEGCDVYEDGKRLGRVKEIERADVDYLLINTDEELVKEGYPKRFMIDFKRHVKDVDIQNKKITASGAIDILESLK
ncbi:ribosome maturation factor RimM [Caminibacter pacificus]|uniref:Ribosome maturation factor RimM n=1 Tax=Caminibacter pacificus TaxID=1424653 RepID=A0AAJ4RD31_9BACT|nr:ribosome maturation factor RimM [Caminibacter pacificus]NPA87670.1 16S rRNA processing protein RimM [Campylobacterota bacterium]QCI27782.1 16S rRNA processing protein RimM [Caminibacter pacificus]ROR40043.1 16S rRNA processing protein RimM [Caminibacter pacificus]